MAAIPSALGFIAMPRKDTATERTQQVNFRLKTVTVERMERYKDRHPLHPTLTQMVEAAVADWLDKHEPELPKRPAAR